MTPTGTVTVEASVDARTENGGGLSYTGVRIRLCVSLTVKPGQAVTLEDMPGPQELTDPTRRADVVLTDRRPTATLTRNPHGWIVPCPA